MAKEARPAISYLRGLTEVPSTTEGILEQGPNPYPETPSSRYKPAPQECLNKLQRFPECGTHSARGRKGDKVRDVGQGFK